jgi:hypothetical protein
MAGERLSAAYVRIVLGGARFEDERDDVIKFRLVPTNFFTRWPCHVCGGVTDKDSILCEADSPFSDRGTLRICTSCLKCGNFDHHLEQQAQALEAKAALIRSLIGRIEAPSYAEWEHVMADYDAEWERDEANETSVAIPDDWF